MLSSTLAGVKWSNYVNMSSSTFPNQSCSLKQNWVRLKQGVSLSWVIGPNSTRQTEIQETAPKPDLITPTPKQDTRYYALYSNMALKKYRTNEVAACLQSFWQCEKLLLWLECISECCFSIDVRIRWFSYCITLYTLYMGVLKVLCSEL